MSRISASGISVIIFATFILQGTAQAGFFDQLFGGTRSGSGSFFGFPFGGGEDRPIRRRSYHVRKLDEEKPIRQATTDIMHDPTLQYGDAVMTKTGVSIFTGEPQLTHDARDFTSLQKVRHIKPGQKLALAEIDAVRTGRVLEQQTPRRLVTGRSSADASQVSGSQISEGVMIKDRDGKPIRYVGP